MLVLVAGLTASCDPGDVTLVEPERGVGNEAALTVHAVLNESDFDLAASLGWEEGVPHARVRVHRTRDPYGEEYWTVAETDASGLVAFPDLLSGLYEVEITRNLSEEEAALAGSGTRVVAGGRWQTVPREDPQVVLLNPNRAGGLVFGEIGIVTPHPWEVGGSYGGGRFMEIYNNSDQTYYLDGMILGFAWDVYTENSYWPCSLTASIRTDPDGIWSRALLRFPGGGNDYPLGPGGTVLVASSATDHTPVHASLTDLTIADFEFPLGGTAGNPGVPNLLDVGPRTLFYGDPLTRDPIFLATPVELGVLPVWIEPINGNPYLRIPRENIVEAVVGKWDSARSGNTVFFLCNQALHPTFETLPGPAVWSSSDGAAWTAQRRVIGHVGGRAILQDTNTSMADFVRAWKTPGWTADTMPGGAE